MLETTFSPSRNSELEKQKKKQKIPNWNLTRINNKVNVLSRAATVSSSISSARCFRPHHRTSSRVAVVSNSPNRRETIHRSRQRLSIRSDRVRTTEEIVVVRGRRSLRCLFSFFSFVSEGGTVAILLLLVFHDVHVFL